MRLQQLRDAVVAGEGVRITKVERISAGGLQTPIKIAADAAAGHESDIFEPVERRRRQTITLEKADGLAFHLRELAHLQKNRRCCGALQKLRFRTEPDPQLVRIHL